MTLHESIQLGTAQFAAAQTSEPSGRSDAARAERLDRGRRRLLPGIGVRILRRSTELGWVREPRLSEHRASCSRCSTRLVSAPPSSSWVGWRIGSRISCAPSAGRGHELASHSYEHRLVYDTSPSVSRRSSPGQARAGVCRGRANPRLSGTELLDYASVTMGARRLD